MRGRVDAYIVHCKDGQLLAFLETFLTWSMRRHDYLVSYISLQMKAFACQAVSSVQGSDLNSFALHVASSLPLRGRKTLQYMITFSRFTTTEVIKWQAVLWWGRYKCLLYVRYYAAAQTFEAQDEGVVPVKESIHFWVAHTCQHCWNASTLACASTLSA